MGDGAIGPIEAPRPGEAEIVFIGDSITRDWAQLDPALFRGRCDRGIGGQTTIHLRRRFQADVIDLRPRAVHIMAGTNDLWHIDPGPEADTTVANLAAMAELAEAHAIRVILAAVPPVSAKGAAMLAHPELLPVLNARITALCAAAGLFHVDYAQVLCDARGVLDPRFTTDGIHFRQAGYRAMHDLAESVIQAALAG